VQPEEWRFIPEWPEYEASSLGRVRRVVKRKGNEGIRVPFLNDGGYLFLAMRHPGRPTKSVGVHRLVARAFKGDPPTPAHQAAHRDGDKTNNAPSNLRWATRSENEMDKVGHGRSNRGARHRLVILTEDEVREIKQKYQRGMKQVPLSLAYGVHLSTIWSITHNRSWQWVT
jgi:HNH endonuclease/NUMOD4 motif